MYQAVVSAMNHPDPYNPYMGLFNARSFASLGAQGVDIDVVSPRPRAPPVGPYSEYGRIPAEHDYGPYDVSYPRFAYLLPQKLFKYTLSSRSIQKMLPAYLEANVATPDICHAGHIHYDGYGLLPYCRENDIPLTVMGRGKILNNYHDLATVSQRKIRATLEYADGILCVSDSLAQIAQDIVDEPKATVLPNGADPSRYPTENESQIRSEMGLDPETTVVLFCGGYTERKGIHEIREAVDDIDHDDVHMVFAGHYGDLRADLIDSLQASPVDSYQVLWEVPPLALRRWFAVADIFMLPSHAEGRPNTVYESMASETAVVASEVSGIPEQVADGESGRLIPPRDPGALAAALDRLIEDETTRNRFAENGLARLRSKGWTWEAHGERLADIHESILDGDWDPSRRTTPATHTDPLVKPT
ncbi:glycosyltransferase family 4 protein [Halomicroarcula sp. F28]|uniref:glycosyltransferase family 4 protein n=1 Tax=Haloarcula salinisoli TaxID=2487746 RepID=UPI001C72E730|nr:glycosyltransferase family 4 protein [Halomicroarcula salinisoli]MBX0285620.1 glycosyltransferase family 4 protein [Halomicroarcula salinisoli]